MAAESTVITNSGVSSMIVMSILSTVIILGSITKCWSLSFARYIVLRGGVPVSLRGTYSLLPHPAPSIKPPLLMYRKRGGAAGGNRRPRGVVVESKSVQGVGAPMATGATSSTTTATSSGHASFV